MRSLRTLAYAAFLALSMFTIQPTLAAAEDVRGVFTLSHEVHWQNCVLKPGDYSFSFKSNGLPTLLTLRGLNGTGTDAMLLVSEVETSKPDEATRLLLVSRDGKSFVSSMSLPSYDMVLHFAVPAESARTIAMK
jgi:hypothetical protein